MSSSPIDGSDPLKDLSLVNQVFNTISSVDGQSSDKKIKGKKGSGDNLEVDEAKLNTQASIQEQNLEDELQVQALNLNVGNNSKANSVVRGLNRLNAGPNKV